MRDESKYYISENQTRTQKDVSITENKHSKNILRTII